MQKHNSEKKSKKKTNSPQILGEARDAVYFVMAAKEAVRDAVSLVIHKIPWERVVFLIPYYFCRLLLTFSRKGRGASTKVNGTRAKALERHTSPSQLLT